MLIDWFTVGAQVLNFIILAWLLKRFLYKPILDAIDVREKKIAAQLADAQAKQAQAQQEREKFQARIDDLDQQSAALLKKATEDANAERERILEAARQAADTLSAMRQDSLRNDAARLGEFVSRKTREEVFAISRKALKDLAGVSLEQRMSEVFIQKLGALTGEARENLASALQTTDKPTLLRSAFDLLPAQQDAIRTAVNETFCADVPLRFETDPDLVSGIELATEGQRLSWSIDEYLRSLGESVVALLEAHSSTVARPGPETEANTV